MAVAARPLASTDVDRAVVDVLVVGAGMAGLAAAASATELGANAGVVEKLPAIGGSAAMSAGMLWTARNAQELRERMPEADRALGEALTDDFPEVLEWVRATGVQMVGPIDGPYFGWGLGWQVDIGGLFTRWRDRIEGAGGWIVRGTAARELLFGADGSVRGAVAASPDGRVEIEASAVVLAGGGFQGDPELVTQLIGRHADHVLVRSNAGSVGDGLRMARAAGAGLSRSLSGFYGHLMPYPIEDFGERHFLPLTQYHSIYMILVNRFGRRFVDETLGDEVSNQEVLLQPDQRAILLADERMRLDHVITAPYPQGEVVDRFAEAARAGANYAVGATIGELIAKVSEWGVPPDTLARTLADYDAAAGGSAIALDAPLPRIPHPLVEPPLHALEVQPAITYPLGGIHTDAQARALDRDGAPIPNLFAAGADAGGLYHVYYAGGLAMSAVFGRRAGRSAAALVSA